MSSTPILYCMRIGIVTAVFSAGSLCGYCPSTVRMPRWVIWGVLLKNATDSGGALGSVAQLATAITDMEKHVNGLRKNIDTLKKVKTALGGR